ncbi:MAG TPA: CoB--CoM heterodisulfide reductase iron-sulfur subunit A family protein [Anaerolineae bacterium]|nr:CoB--CoM heterodisulfide reductase iron-sulfur subunit A family protein [Anaerolineae bacterium]
MYSGDPIEAGLQQERGVLVIGGGVGGMRAAIDLAEAGIHTYLLENTPSLGGRVAQLGFMFPTHDCVLCRGTSDHGFGCTRPAITPALMDHNCHPNITVLTSTDLISCEGQAGDFRVVLQEKPQIVNASLCINCGRCAEVCPEIRPSGFQLGLSSRKLIDKSAPRSLPNAYYLLQKTDRCEDCRKCVEVCPTDAIDLEAAPKPMEIHVGAVIMAMGFQPFDPSEMPELGYGRIPDVITSMQYERLASRSGPTEGIVRRISNNEVPKRIAWLQCIGSRDQRNPYCSSICCMYATKEAMLAKERIDGVECHIFTMDERAFNKEYNFYYQKARDDFGINYTRCRISSVDEDPETGEVILRFPAGRIHEEAAHGQGAIQEERFDLLVLTVGIRPPKDAVKIAQQLGINLNEYGFCETDKFAPLSTSRPGVFVCGAFASPKEIAETILDASGAAAEAMRIMHDQLGSRTFSRAQPFLSLESGSTVQEEKPKDPAISVVLCGCAGEISNIIDLKTIADQITHLEGVKKVEILPLACLQDGKQQIRDLIRSNGANRLVIGACSHRTHEPLFQRLVAETGINPYLVEVVNLREHCAWVHPQDHQGATHKAYELMRMGIERIRHAVPIIKEERKPVRAALVIGGGVSGMTAALGIADAGYDVHLVEKDNELGGNLRHVYYVAEGDNPQRLLRDLVNRILSHERISLHIRSQIVRHTGSVGDFRARIRSQRSNGSFQEEEIRHAVTILATGGKEAGGSRYLLGKDPRVIPQSELEQILAHQPERATRLRSVVMIQCVMPEDGIDYCSRICCTNSLKNALRLKMLNPDCQVVILYKNIITYGFREKYYIEARRRGVLFVRYTENDPPRVRIELSGSRLKTIVDIQENIFGRTLSFEPDLLALSMAVQPAEDTSKLAQMLGVPQSPEGFFQESHLKMRPMEFADEGIFLTGMAHYPKFLEECITHSLACVGRALTILSRPTIQLGGVIAVVDPDRCTGCLTCVRTCPFGIPEIRIDQVGVGGLDGAAWINPARCQGCGTCTAECPARAIQLRHYHDDQIRVGLGQWEQPLPELAAD